MDTCITNVELQIPIDGYKPKFNWTGRDLVPEPITSKHIRLKLYKHSNVKHGQLGVSNEFAHLILTTKKWVCSPHQGAEILAPLASLTSRKSEQFHQKALSWVRSRYQDSRTHICKYSTVRYLFSPEPLLDFCMHYMHDYHTSPHFHRFLLFYLAKIGENGGK